MQTNTAPRTFGPGTYHVHGRSDLPPFPRETWKFVVNPDGTGDWYNADGFLMITYSPEEEPCETLRAWEDHYGFRVEEVC